MSARRTRHHQMTVTIRADRPITRGAALRVLRNELRGATIAATLSEEEKDGWRAVKVTGVR